MYFNYPFFNLTWHTKLFFCEVDYELKKTTCMLQLYRVKFVILKSFSELFFLQHLQKMTCLIKKSNVIMFGNKYFS